MKRRSDLTFRIWSLIMVLFGIFLIAMDFYLMLNRFQNPDISRFLTLVMTLLLLGAGVLEIVAGVKGFIFSNNVSRGRRYRAITSKVQSFKRLAVSALFLSVIEVIASLVIGILIWQIAAICVAGIFVPLLYITRAKALRV